MTSMTLRESLRFTREEIYIIAGAAAFIAALAAVKWMGGT